MSSATISSCGVYRYTLHRHVPCALRWVQPCLFVLLNPSTANAELDDPTIRRCMGFATSWSCTELTVVNLFALRSTDPDALLTHADPFGPDNRRHLVEQVARVRADHIILGWGAHPAAKRAMPLQLELQSIGAQCLGENTDGSPKHPLYLKADTQRRPWGGPKA